MEIAQIVLLVKDERTMFNNVEENIMMLRGAYRKLKSYYFYNRNLLMMRKKIADFEENESVMNDVFYKLATILQNPRTKIARDYVKRLISEVDFIVLPKKFDSEITTSNKPISNTIARDKRLKNVNFFIDAPIEIYILDTLWTVFLSKIAYDNKILSYDVYGNTINASALFQGDEIQYDNRNLFNRYFHYYSYWRNRAFDALEKNYNQKKDSVLISLDVKSYFYSVTFSFNNMNRLFGEHQLFNEISTLSSIMEKVFSCYASRVLPYRCDISKLKKSNLFLPIGLFSSMVLGNVYLSDFDKAVRKQERISYYGRYVDDILLVFEKEITKDLTNKDIINCLLVEPDLLKEYGSEYVISELPNLRIQSEKIKILYIDHNESKAIIDIYNDTIRVVPSQVDPIPDSTLNLSNFDEIAYTVENFTKEKKIRDMGHMEIDTFKVGKYFSNLVSQYAHTNVMGAVSKDIDHHIFQINNFFVGSQGIEFYTNWLNYAYFLVITQRNKQLKEFYYEMRNQIGQIKGSSLDRSMYLRRNSINKKVKDALLEHLNICIDLALVLDCEMLDRHFKSRSEKVRKYEHSNMFDHKLVSFPLANYLEYSNSVSYIKMDVKDIGKIPKSIKNEFKFVWSPRFIHYDEIILLRFYYYHRTKDSHRDYEYINGAMVEEYCAINHIKSSPFVISSNELVRFDDYIVNGINIPTATKNQKVPKELSVAVGSVNITTEKCMKGCKRWDNISIGEKRILDGILKETNRCCKKREIMLLVLPELYFPFYWIGELIRFAKMSQIAIVTGLQYMVDSSGKMRNYVATLLPFTSGTKGYKNVFVHIREKNDYSPIEFEGLAKNGYACENPEIARYQIFKWNEINVASIVCYEMTDVMIRALLKGRCDIIAAPVFNPDTTYFSNIIDSTVRDLHAFIVQANTSGYGDSRVTGPYDRDSKDIFKIKGGDNDHVVVGTIQFKKVKDFEEKQIKERLNDKVKKKKKTYQKTRPDIKPLSARYKKKI